jgi:hypothetical protein
MNNYRIYLPDNSGHTVGVEKCVSATDDDAVLIAKQLLEGHDLEVWQGDRQIALIPSLKPGSSADNSAERPAAETPPLSIACGICGRRIRLTVVEPVNAGDAYTYQCSNLHCSEFVATEQVPLRFSGL